MPLSERRAVNSNIPAFADNQPFQNGTVCVSVEVTPEWRKSPAGDIVLRGFIAGKEIEVLFAGSRRNAALQLAQRLKEHVEKMKETARSQGREAVPSDARQTLVVDGAWQVRLLAEQRGMPVRRFQLVAARWRYQGAGGNVFVDGHLPYG